MTGRCASTSRHVEEQTTQPNEGRRGDVSFPQPVTRPARTANTQHERGWTKTTKRVAQPAPDDDQGHDVPRSGNLASARNWTPLAGVAYAREDWAEFSATIGYGVGANLQHHFASLAFTA
jgi:hypothetical protein